jgi:hypothetical protein
MVPSLTHGLLQLIMLGVIVWCYWKILGKAGFRGWWAFLMVPTLILTFGASAANDPFVLFAPYVIPAAMIWVFAFIRWPSFEVVPGQVEGRYQRGGDGSPGARPSDDPHRSVNPRFRDGAEAVAQRRRRRKRKENT